MGWFRPGLPCLPVVSGPFQHHMSALPDAWTNLVSEDLCCCKGGSGGPLLDHPGLMQLLNASHVRDRDKALLRGVLSGSVWNGFVLRKAKGQTFHAACVGGPDAGHLFWECLYQPFGTWTRRLKRARLQRRAGEEQSQGEAEATRGEIACSRSVVMERKEKKCSRNRLHHDLSARYC